jgi:hypothetical protein
VTVCVYINIKNLYRCHQQKDLDIHQVFGAHHLYIHIYTVQCGGQGWTLWCPCLYTPWRRHFTLDQDSEISKRKIELISLIILLENFNLDYLHSKPRCDVVSKAISICKNTAAVDMLLLKFNVTWSVSLIYWSVVLWRARKQNWLALSRSLSSIFVWTIFIIPCSNSLPLWTRG